jgi:hypothetical protein
MTLIGTAACGSKTTTTSAPRTGAIPPRESRRCGRGAVVCRRFQRAADQREDVDLAPYQAAIAGRDIFTTSATRTASKCATCSKPSSRAGRLIVRRRSGDRSLHKLFWINSGPFNNLTARKVVLQCTPEAFAAAAQAARRRARRSRRETARRSTSCSRGQADVLRPERRSDGDQQDTAEARTS